jgi:acetyl-CoA synthetase
MPDEPQSATKNIKTGATALAHTTADVSEAQIAVHWKEEEYYCPSAKFIGQANLTDPSVDERFSIEKFPVCFKEYAAMLSWDQYWHTTLDTSNAPFWKWFVGGKLNACYAAPSRR